MSKKTDWEVVGEPLGAGGQSTVYKVRRPARTKKRMDSAAQMQCLADSAKWAEMATKMWAYARPDLPSELAALKVFDKIRREEAAAAERLKSEIAVLLQKWPGLPELVESNEADQWIVTEFFAEGTLEDNPRYAGQPGRALKAFRSLLETVAALHKKGIVHRDIKPANIFLSGGWLVPGDFGIVYLPNAERVTRSHERVGPRDYMPPWGDLGERLEKVEPNFDVYMLGKLLWCMLSGKLRLPREDHREPDFDLSKMFPKLKPMESINSILDKCLVKKPEDCLRSAGELLVEVDGVLAAIGSDAPWVNEKGILDLRCLICGRGVYRPVDPRGPYGNFSLATYDGMQRHVGSLPIRGFTCDVCGSYALFAPGYPEEAAPKLRKK